MFENACKLVLAKYLRLSWQTDKQCYSEELPNADRSIFSRRVDAEAVLLELFTNEERHAIYSNSHIPELDDVKLVEVK